MSVFRAFCYAVAGLALGLRACVAVRTAPCGRSDSSPTARAGDPETPALSGVAEGFAAGAGAIALLVGAIRVLARGVAGGGSITWLDRAATLRLRRVARARLTSSIRVVTWLGSLVVLLPLTSLLCGLLVRRGRRADALLLAAATLGAAILNPSVKHLVARSRPSLVKPLISKPSTFSFPSGHAAVASAFYLALALIVSEGRGWDVARRTRFVWGATAVPGLVGFSRVYLGVHYLSDVVGGAALGACWVVTCVVAGRLPPATRLRRRAG
jgi:membrane-associated phospholipid phosphatase